MRLDEAEACCDTDHLKIFGNWYWKTSGCNRTLRSGLARMLLPEVFYEWAIT
jgi:hypothetical protein